MLHLASFDFSCASGYSAKHESWYQSQAGQLLFGLMGDPKSRHYQPDMAKVLKETSKDDDKKTDNGDKPKKGRGSGQKKRKSRNGKDQGKGRGKGGRGKKRSRSEALEEDDEDLEEPSDDPGDGENDDQDLKIMFISLFSASNLRCRSITVCHCQLFKFCCNLMQDDDDELDENFDEEEEDSI